MELSAVSATINTKNKGWQSLIKSSEAMAWIRVQLIYKHICLTYLKPAQMIKLKVGLSVFST